MTKRSKVLYSVIVVFIVTIGLATFIVKRNADKVEPRPFPKEEEVTQSVNEWAKQVVKENKQPKSTAEKAKEAAADSAMITFLKFLAVGSVQDIEFFGKIVDQRGNPVAGVTVDYIGSRSILASGSGPGQVISDSNGRFVVDEATGDSLRIMKLSKLGYQFPAIGALDMPRGGSHEGITWADYTRDSPYLIKAWQVDRYPDVIHVSRDSARFKPDGREKSLILPPPDSKISDQEGVGDFGFIYRQAPSGWKIELLSKNGIVLTNDEFLYQAPDEGYNNSIVLTGIKRRRRAEKLYFKSDRTGLFGAMKLTVRPSSNPDKTHLRMSYTINLEGGKNLTVKQAD